MLYDPSRVEALKSVRSITEEGRKLIKEHYNSDYRVRTVSVRLLELHALYADLLSDALIEKAQGNDEKANELKEKLRIEIGKYELQFERWYDHALYCYALGRMFNAKTLKEEANNVESN